jgi:hypothetical protein
MKLVTCALLGVLLSGCSLLETATSDRPNTTQRNAMGDIFGSIGAFIGAVNDPAAVDDGDLADIHATEPYRALLDPNNEGVAASARRAPGRSLVTPGCAAAADGVATWDCDFSAEVGGVTTDCHATGSGQDNGDGTYSGESLQTCPGLMVNVTATNLMFDEVAGAGGGRLFVELGTDALAGWADVTLTSVTFCTEEATPAPNGGTMEVDGQGALDNLPFDPITLEFKGDPECGIVLIQ